jgi:hypothetical protein
MARRQGLEPSELTPCKGILGALPTAQKHPRLTGNQLSTDPCWLGAGRRGRPFAAWVHPLDADPIGTSKVHHSTKEKARKCGPILASEER